MPERGKQHRAPKRVRCFACRKYFGFEIIDGLYCSRYCAGLPPLRFVRPVPLPPDINVPELPRSCRTVLWLRPYPRAKQRYRSMEDAAVVAEQQSRPGKDQIHAYKCPNCPYYHVGHDKYQEDDDATPATATAG